WILRGDFDRLVDHRSNAKGVDRTHGIRLVPVLKANAVCRWSTREGVRHTDLTIGIEVHEVLPRMRFERSSHVDSEQPSFFTHLCAARASARRETVQDPQIEVALDRRETGTPTQPEFRCGDLRGR